MAYLASKTLFYLVPMTPDASRIVKDNQKYARTLQTGGREVSCLSFKAGHRSVYPGHLVAFGCHRAAVDIYLDGLEYIAVQCVFYLAPSGELMLSDHSRHGNIRWEEDGKVLQKYDLQGDPRRRVIPRANAKISVFLTEHAAFEFIWAVDVSKAAQASMTEKLSRIAQNLDENGTASLRVPRSPFREASDYEAKTRLTPVVPADLQNQPIRQVHFYDDKGSGSFGQVSRAVDLATGRLWAVKQPKNYRTEAGEDWKKTYKREVQKIAECRHDNILRLEHSQGWTEGAQVQIFFPIWDGSVDDLIRSQKPRHACTTRPVATPSWVPDFINQILDALEYVHARQIVHRDIKPANILFRTRSSGQGYRFCLADFGLVANTSSIDGLCGTIAYFAPEQNRSQTTSTASDVYSFGVTLLEALGKFCVNETDMSVSAWQDKLKALGAKGYRDYRDEVPKPRTIYPVLDRSHSRVESLSIYGLLRPGVSHVLEMDPKNRASAKAARRELLENYPLARPRAQAVQVQLPMRPAEPRAAEPRVELKRRPSHRKEGGVRINIVEVEPPQEGGFRRRNTDFRK